MSSEFTVHYTEPLVRAAVGRFWRRALGWKFVLAVLAIVVIVGYQVSRGDRSWYVGMLGTVAALGVLLTVVGYIAQYRRAMGSFRRLSGGTATFTVSDGALRMSSAIGSTEFSWNAIQEVWRYPDLWLLVFSRNMFATMPLAGVSGPTLELIEKSVSAAGGRVA